MCSSSDCVFDRAGIAALEGPTVTEVAFLILRFYLLFNLLACCALIAYPGVTYVLLLWALGYYSMVLLATPSFCFLTG